jgi:hypothetical protein
MQRRYHVTGTQRRLFLLLVAVVAGAGCEYPGAGTQPNQDYSMASSGIYVVAAGLSSVSAYPTWDFRDPRAQFAPSSAFSCGQGSPPDGPAVAWGANRFWYLTGVGIGACVLSAPDNNPFAFDRSYLFSRADFGLPSGVSGDRPFITVSNNKVAASMDVLSASPSTNTLVLNLADVLAGAPVRHNLIRHGNVVRFAPVVGSADNLFWLYRTGGNTIGVGRLTGTPGTISTSSTTVGIGPGMDYPVGVLLGTAPWGGASPTLIVAVLSNGGTLYLDALTGLSGTLNPTVVAAARADVPAIARNSLALYQQQFSLSATPTGNVLAGFVSNGAPWAMVWPFLQGVTLVAVDTNITSPTTGRIDFLPLGAAFPDLSGNYPGQWFAGIGWIDNTAKWTWAFGQHSVFLRDNQF